VDYIGSDGSYNWLFWLMILSVIQWFVSGYFVIKHFSEIGSDIRPPSTSRLRLSDDTQRVGFLRDSFYHLWNLYPIVLYFLFYYLELSWNVLMAKIDMIGGPKAHALYQDLFVKYPQLDYLALAFIMMLAFLSTFGTQRARQLHLVKTKSKIYWWDKRLIPALFYTRFVFLFFNMILIGFISYLTLKITLYVFGVLALDTLTINPFHPDGYGGLRVVVEIVAVLISIYFLRATLGIIGLFDHAQTKDKVQFLGDVYHFMYLFVGVFLLYHVIDRSNALIDRAGIRNLFVPFDDYRSLTDQLTHEHNQTLYDTFASQVAPGHALQGFPVDLGLLSGSLLSLAIPLGLMFLVGFFKHNPLNLLLQSLHGNIGENRRVLCLIVGSFGIFLSYLAFASFTSPLQWLHTLSVAAIGYFGLMAIPLFALFTPNRSVQIYLRGLWIFFATLLLLDLPAMFFRVNNTPVPEWLRSSLYLLAVILAILIYAYGITDPKRTTRPPTTKHIATLLAFAVLTMILYHGSNYYMKFYKNIPNIDRSLFIGGLEWHHINFGVIMLLLTPLLYARNFLRINSYALYALLGGIYGTILDECYYYTQTPVTDNAYFEPQTFWIQIATLLLIMLLWFITHFFIKRYHAPTA
jgi:hypothetical protein